MSRTALYLSEVAPLLPLLEFRSRSGVRVAPTFLRIVARSVCWTRKTHAPRSKRRYILKWTREGKKRDKERRKRRTLNIFSTYFRSSKQCWKKSVYHPPNYMRASALRNFSEKASSPAIYFARVYNCAPIRTEVRIKISNKECQTGFSLKPHVVHQSDEANLFICPEAYERPLGNFAERSQQATALPPSLSKVSSESNTLRRCLSCHFLNTLCR